MINDDDDNNNDDDDNNNNNDDNNNNNDDDDKLKVLVPMQMNHITHRYTDSIYRQTDKLTLEFVCAALLRSSSLTSEHPTLFACDQAKSKS